MLIEKRERKRRQNMGANEIVWKLMKYIFSSVEVVIA